MTTEHYGMSAPTRPTNAYTPPPSALRKAAAVAPPPTPAGPELVPVFKVGRRKIKQAVIAFDDRRIRVVTPKLAALETIAEHQELLMQFADPGTAHRQTLKALGEVTAIMRELVPYMVPGQDDRDYIDTAFDDETIEETDLITAILMSFSHIMGIKDTAGAVASATAAAAASESVPPVIDGEGGEAVSDVPDADAPAEDDDAVDAGGAEASP